jgi:hypothetical protein
MKAPIELSQLSDTMKLNNMDYSRASRENTHTVQRMRMEKSGRVA